MTSPQSTAISGKPSPPNGTEVLLDTIESQLDVFASAGAPSLADPQTARILVIDDEPINIKVIQKYLHGYGYPNVRGISDPTFAFDTIRSEPTDVILLDVMMPRVSGMEVLQQIRGDAATAHLPVIILTASCDRETKLAVLDRGATDFLAKPVDIYELMPRVRNALTQKRYHDQLRGYASHLEDAVRQRTAELEASRKEVIYCLARAAELRDDDTGHHVLRVGQYAAVIGRSLGLDSATVEMLEQAAQLHDIGKIGIPDEILLKPGKLDPEQYERMKRHAVLGKRIIEPLPDHSWERLKGHVFVGQQVLECGSSPVLKMAAQIALTHHEHWDGTGYPLGLAGEDIPLEGRITAVADVFDALASKRPYKAPLPFDRCFAMIAEERGKHFDPRVVETFLRCRSEITAIQLQYADLV
jgi:putative two-component system response regulator